MRLSITDEQRKEDIEDLRQEVRNCFNIAQRLDALNPEAPGAFTGTPSERIDRQLKILLDGYPRS